MTPKGRPRSDYGLSNISSIRGISKVAKIKLTAKKYTMPDIEAHWEIYRKAKGWRVLRNGKWTIYMDRPDTTDGATRVDMVNIRHFVDFPRFLKLMEK